MKQKSLWIAAFLMITGCAKELPVNTFPEKTDMAFSAECTVATKTSLSEDNRVFWTAGDAISLFSQAAPEQNERFTGSAITEATATFTGKAVTGEKYYAVYPYRPENKLLGTTLSLTIPAQQALQNGSFANETNPSVAIADGNSLQFKNVAALVSFQVPVLNGAAIVKAVFKGNAGEKVAGEMKVDMNQEVKSAVPAETAVTEAVLTGKFVEGETYYLVTAPAEFAQGIQLSLFDESGKSYSIKGTSAVTATAGKILPLAGFKFVPDEKLTDFYVKVDGKGNGSSWAEATSLTNALAWAEDGNTIHVAAGKYLPAASATGFNAFELKTNAKLIGGYPADASDGAVANAELNETVLSGNNTMRVLLVSAQKAAGQVAGVNGFTITEGNSAKTSTVIINGGSLYQNYGAGIAVIGANFILENSRVIKNTGRNSPGLYNCEDAFTTIDHCLFEGQRNNHNGANIWSTQSKLIIKNSTIKNNKTSNGVAGGLHLHGNTDAKKKAEMVTYIYNTCFEDNATDGGKSSRRGGAIYARNDTKTVLVNCTFTQNFGGNGAAVSLYGTSSNKSHMEIINCTFSGNESKFQASLEQCANTTMHVYNSIISGNISTSEPADVLVGASGIKPTKLVNSIIGTKVYDNTGNELSGQVFDYTTMLSPYLNGVIRLQGTDNPAVTAGMSTADLADIDLSMFPDFEASYLEIDQNGKPRTGNHMGACVE